MYDLEIAWALVHVVEVTNHRVIIGERRVAIAELINDVLVVARGGAATLRQTFNTCSELD